MPVRAPVIARVTVTPVAVPDPPLLNAAGCHAPYALRSLVEVEDASGRVGLGEAYGDDATVEALRAAGERITGLDPWNLAAVEAGGLSAPPAPPGPAGETALGGAAHHAPGATRSFARNAYAAIEVACLDLQGQHAQVPVAELLGGRQRDEVAFSAYLFYKFAQHAPRPDGSSPPPPDAWGEALDAPGMVRQARRFQELYGFTTFKLKGGVFPPEREVDAVAALRVALGSEAPLRLDPNGIWTVETSVAAGARRRAAVPVQRA